ncbi:MAG: bifunctional diaminohydroxyphosphoribosylaminopyrimidine deaminase/5-amino-6-(5-phosphoribosylamino)uracil reductase RibD [bacterium]
MGDDEFQNRAIELAARGLGHTRSNPLVGACLVRDGNIIAEGFHRAYGEQHAEVDLLSSIEDIPSDSTLYLTLEPCVKHGKTGPCLNRLVESGIRNYVILSRDNSSSASGAGLEALKRLGYSVEEPETPGSYRWLNRHFFHGADTGLPWVDLKLAMTADGYIATPTGESQWITGQESRGCGHRLRSQVDGVLVGGGTLRSDNPRLTDRTTGRDRQPEAIGVVRSSDGLSLSAHLFDERPDKTILVVPPTFSTGLADRLEKRGVTIMVADLYNGEFDWRQVLVRLRKKSLGRLLVEGGSMTAGSLLRAGLVNELHLFYSGRIFGSGIPAVGMEPDDFSVEDASEGQLIHQQAFGNDLYVRRFLPENTPRNDLREINFDRLDLSV